MGQNLRTALCLGGGSSLHDDIEKCPIEYDGVVACNDAGTVWEGELEAWVTLHPKKFAGWIKKRQDNGFPDAKKLYAHASITGRDVIVTPYKFPHMQRSGSSGLFAAKVALMDLGYDRAVLAGIGMLQDSHYFDKKPWASATHFRGAFTELPPRYREMIRSCSGWTRLFFGPPEDWL